ncbi:unnamed protein product, partial [Ectocarpus fasciculatus]
GYKVADIENLAVLQDQFDLIDLSDNELRALENFPGMTRLSSLFVSNNYVCHVGCLGEQLRNLSTLVLSNNRINSLSEIDNIATLSKLELLSLTDNQVTHLPKYRLYVIFRIPSLKCLDFQKVRRVEREEAAQFFSSAAGLEFIGAVSGMKAAPDTAAKAPAPPAAPAPTTLTDAQKAEVRKAIQGATTREEVDIIEKQLRVWRFSCVC